jgi:hypothetical protein
VTGQERGAGCCRLDIDKFHRNPQVIRFGVYEVRLRSGGFVQHERAEGQAGGAVVSGTGYAAGEAVLAQGSTLRATFRCSRRSLTGWTPYLRRMAVTSRSRDRR